MNQEEKQALLEILSQITPGDAAAESEQNTLEDFLPLKDYQQVVAPKNFVILGDRGAGKTKLFNALNESNGYASIYHNVSSKSLLPDPEKIRFAVGYRERTSDFPSQVHCDMCVHDEHQITAFWLGCMCFVVFHEFHDTIEIQTAAERYFAPEFLHLLQSFSNLSHVQKWLPIFETQIVDGESFLDDVERYLMAEKRWFVLCYDGLDMVSSNYDKLLLFIRVLLQFWSSHNRRWKYLCAKIFLRTDLYDHPKIREFPDSSKITGFSVELKWTSRTLYQLLIKRFANCKCDTNGLAIAYIQKISDRMLVKSDTKELGWLPTDNSELHKSFIDTLIGKYMGNNPKKGASYTWVPNHIQDANGNCAPRAFLKCFMLAADSMLQHPEEIGKLTEEHLLTPSVIQSAMVGVSKDRVAEICESYRWLKKLQDMLTGLQLLATQEEFLDRIDMGTWTEQEQKLLPGEQKRDILEFLCTIGIIYYASDGRINVPEIYLHGFSMVRKGGLKKYKEDD